MPGTRVPVDTVSAAAYEIPTDLPESDGTLAWTSTVLIVVTATAGGHCGIGYTYAGPAAARIVRDTLADVVTGQDALTPAATWAAMQVAVRNLGRTGVVACAISAVDIALWDLYARLVEVPLAAALGGMHEEVPVYGSGGFTSYDDRTLAAQLSDWVEAGIPRVKMKVGRDRDADPRRVREALDAIGDDAVLFVDANGAYGRKDALWWAEYYGALDIGWFEEPVSSDDLEGLRLLRDHGPAGLDIAAGEYGYDLVYFRRMLDAGAVDCLQADVTRCLGYTGLTRVAALCDAHGVELSLHCAPQAGAHGAAAVWHLRHLEYFHDHVRIEAMAFDGVLRPAEGGVLRPDPERPGHGLDLRTQDLEEYRVR